MSSPSNVAVGDDGSSDGAVVTTSNEKGKRRERPPALELAYDEHDPEHYDRQLMPPPPVPTRQREKMRPQQSLQISLTPSAPSEGTRTSSPTSSVDNYYYSYNNPSPYANASPLPDPPSTPEHPSTRPPSFVRDPMTPARDPSSIDRRALIGVGELATPRWISRARSKTDWEGKGQGVEEEGPEELEEAAVHDEPQQIEADDRSSPWTIEAVDGDTDADALPQAVQANDQPPPTQSMPRDESTVRATRSKFTDVSDDSQIAAKVPLRDSPEKELTSSYARHPPPVTRTIRSRPSVAEESGGEEILYPRDTALDNKRYHAAFKDKEKEKDVSSPGAPPSSFAPVSKAKKRTSDEFALDQAGTLVSKSSLAAQNERDEKIARRHRSLGAGGTSTRDRERKERRRADGVALSIGGLPKSTSVPSASTRDRERDRHSRHASTSSTNSTHDSSRRLADFSHLPPSPSTSSIQHLLRNSTASVSSATAPVLHPSPSVAHSLLRGTQEGWSALDDSTTAEVLRKLDGISGKSVRARSSVGSINRSGSRPGTPGSKSVAGQQWEGVDPSNHPTLKHQSSTSSKDQLGHGLGGVRMDVNDLLEAGDFVITEEPGYVPPSNPVKKSPVKEANAPGSARSSFGPTKRGSASSTNFTGTPTTGSRDSTSLSTSTSMTSASVASGRYSSGKHRRNSVGSDVSSIHSMDATTQRDRAAALAATGEGHDENDDIPPVPPLPKDFSAYKTPLHSSTSLVFPASAAHAEEQDQTITVPTAEAPVAVPKQTLAPVSSQPRAPTKKWSFSSALNLKLPSSSSSSSKDLSATLSPTSPPFNHTQFTPLTTEAELWTSSHDHSDIHPSPSASSSQLHLSSSPGPAQAIDSSKTPDRSHAVPSRTETASSASTHTTSAPSIQIAMSPSSRRASSKRLTPSAIPFFRRSSSQSMQVTPPTGGPSVSPTLPPVGSSPSSKTRLTPPPNDAMPSPSSASRKSSVLSLGLPSLLKSTSRKSLHSDKEGKSDKDKEKEKKKDEKDRSESRISVLMGRKRGKTLSSTDEKKKAKPAVTLPPMQMSAIPQTTAQRVASLKASPVPQSSRNTSATSNRTPTASATNTLSRASDASLRSSRHHLPTIAGSPSVGTVAAPGRQENPQSQTGPPPAQGPSGSIKDTPTKIPRISSRTSTGASPQPPNKSSTSLLATRRTSLNITNVPAANTLRADPSPSPQTTTFVNDFGVLENGEGSTSLRTPQQSTATNRNSTVRASPQSSSRVPRQMSTTTTTAPPSSRKSTRDSLSFSGLRKSSTASVTSMASAAPNEAAQPSQSRFSALSPSKSIKHLAPKMSLSGARVTGSATSPALFSQHQPSSSVSTSASRQSLSTPSPVPSSVDEDEILGDEEMMQYIRRQQARKLASGANQAELDEMLRFPEPLPPAPAQTPSALLKSSHSSQLSEFEKVEIQDYPNVYYWGARSQKKMATPENTANNNGYDDDRGDYLVVNHDHLAYRYEVLDTLGKGSFGQVLQCRDHRTGQSTAIKIIRNKKRFHHQALVEIKILDNLRKWDPDEKHHVIKMTEHFYFRNHLCIAMELLSINLYELIKANGFAGFTTTLIRRFTSQMLASLCLMRHHRIIHCDLKPENVLLRHPAKSGIKVIDFGSSCLEHEKVYTYIQSRFYRSPEVILGMNYNTAIDMWSLGCILAELYTGFPIFPGENEQEQLSCIMEVLGVPDKDLINKSTRKKLFFDSTGAPRPVVNSKGRRRRPGAKTLAQVLRCDDEYFVDFIAKCLIWDPERRLKPQAALRHPFVTANRRSKITSPTPSSTARSLLASTSASLSSRNKTVTETPKKSQIGAPTPLTARVSSRAPTTSVPATPIANSGLHSTLGASASSHRSYRTSQPTSYHSSRNHPGTVNGYAA